MHRIKYLFSLLMLVVFAQIGAAQTPMGLYFMETIPQSSQINPAMQPRANGFLALPQGGASFQSDMAFEDAFQNVGSEWVTPLSARFNYGDLYNVIGQSANINEKVNTNLLGFGFRSGRDYITFSLGLKTVSQLGMPADMFKIAETGFPDGQSFDFSTMRIKQVAYQEIAIGYSREWNDRWTFGLKFKPLFGIVGGVSKINQFQLNTSRTQWDVNVDGTVYTSAPLDVTEGAPGDFPESVAAKDLTDSEVSSYFSSFKNGGLAFDFGAVYEFSDKITFSAALTNLGYVKFKKDLNALSFNGTYSFDGVAVDDTDQNQIEQAYSDIGDSLKTVINYQVNHDKFSVPLSPSLYVGTSYQWTPSVSFGFLSRSLFQKYNFRQDFSLSTNIQPYSFVSLNVNYSKRIKGAGGLGTALAFLAGPLQLYLAADYIPMRYANVSFDNGESTAVPYKHKDLNFRFGLNLIFGRNGYRDEPMLSAR